MRASVPIFVLTAALLTVLPFEAAAIDASNRYRSPRNPERKVRASTELIVLHTTEAPARSSLNKLSERGEAHFCVTENGSVYRIVDRDKEAFHAGRSMWNGKEDCDKHSIGIECVGYHDKPMPAIQLNAIRDLVKELKAMYRLADDRVVCHSHVAYGAPNKWQKRNHRGRKRCGMLFAMPSVRQYLGLASRPKGDADVRANRLTVGDEYLRKVLYGNVDTMRPTIAKYKKPPPKDVSGVFSWFARKPSADEKPNSETGPRPKSVVTPASPSKTVVKAKPPTKAAAPKSVTPAKAQVSKSPKSIAELTKSGYRSRGKIDKQHTALQLVGERWNHSATYYTIRDKVIPGNKIDARKMEMGMQVWTR